jgi:hypothetical protein
MILKFIYMVFIGVLFATLVGVGIAAFYPQPKYPEYPVHLSYPKAPTEQTEADRQAQIKEQEAYDKKSKDFQEQNQIYSRNVSIIAIIFAIGALVVSLTFLKALQMIADGLLLGGLLTLLYSIVRGFETQDNMFRFIVVAIGFIVAVTVGYIKFSKPAQTQKKS